MYSFLPCRLQLRRQKAEKVTVATDSTTVAVDNQHRTGESRRLATAVRLKTTTDGRGAHLTTFPDHGGKHPNGELICQALQGKRITEWRRHRDWIVPIRPLNWSVDFMIIDGANSGIG